MRNRKDYFHEWYLNHRESEIQKAKERQKINSEMYKKYKRKYNESNKGEKTSKKYRLSFKGKEADKKHTYKRRRCLEFFPLNTWFKDSEAHHLNEKFILYIPKELHKSIKHSLKDIESMKEINDIVIKWYFNYD